MLMLSEEVFVVVSINQINSNRSTFSPQLMYKAFKTYAYNIWFMLV